ncbi:MAG TPA: phospholipase D-like domain-containing protein [Opitutaceae bacterium]
MSTKIITNNWHSHLSNTLKGNVKVVRAMAPFVQADVMRKLFGSFGGEVRLITRLSEEDFYKGVSNLEALKLLIRKGGRVRAVRDLHAKAFVFDSEQTLISSANLTGKAFTKNFELGLWTDLAEIATETSAYFDRLWEQAALDVSLEKLEEIQAVVRKAREQFSTAPTPIFIDHGVAISVAGAEEITTEVPTSTFDLDDAHNIFVKFSGQASTRVSRDLKVIERVVDANFLRGGFYPHNKRPRIVRDGDVMFASTLVKNGNDIMVFGRAYAFAYDPERDVATKDDIKERDWKENWPHYIRWRNAEFLNGTVGDGVSLSELCDTFGPESFVASSKQHKQGKQGDPKSSYKQQPAVRLTRQAAVWLNEQLERRFQRFGVLGDMQLQDALERWTVARRSMS